jgi:hypothetical protein
MTGLYGVPLLSLIRGTDSLQVTLEVSTRKTVIQDTGSEEGPPNKPMVED